ncbi:MAG TPA: nitrilase-related carbon-nitrogen hydrolase [Myxococcaceae bacterium]
MAFWDERAQPLAWVGLVVLTLAFHRAGLPRRALAGGFMALLLKQVVALYWMLPTQVQFLKLTWLTGLGICLLMFVLMVGILFAPLAVGILLQRWLPIRWWLPVAWAVGEVLLEHLSGAAMGHWLHSQWAMRPVLHSLAFLGWFPTLLLGLYTCASMGDAIAARSPRALCAPLALTAFLLLLPPIPVPEDPLRGIAAMNLATASQVPTELPAGVELLVWPEASVRGRHRLSEGPQRTGARLSTFTPPFKAHNLIGLMLKTPEGNLNAAAAVDPEGVVHATRGKSVLVPVGERPFWGMPVLNGEGLSPGRQRPLLSVASTRVVPLICYEAFSRTMVMSGKQSGGKVLAVLASDRPLAGSRIAIEQSLGVVLLRSVEFQLPAVRASLGGISALMSPDGRILARSSLGRSEVLVTSASSDPAPRPPQLPLSHHSLR